MRNMFKPAKVSPPQVSPPESAPTPSDENQEVIHKAQREACAIVRALKPRLEEKGISEDALWDWVKGSHEVTSRKELTEKQWVTLAARLAAAQKIVLLFSDLCDTITATAGTCRAYRIHANGTFRKIYDGIITADIEERCQRQADESGCKVRLHGADGADGILFFDPAEFAHDPNCPPIGEFDKNKPARVFEIHTQGNETQYIEIPFPDTPKLEVWGQARADETGYDIKITDRLGHQVLMQFTAPKKPPQVVHGTNEVTIDGQEWILLNQWDDQWHWVKLDGTIERHIATANNRDEAVDSLITHIGNNA